MFGLDYVMAGYMHLASGQITCNLKKAPEITVSASDTTVKYDHTKSQTQLDNFTIDTISPYGKNVQSHVGGLMSGEVSISQNMRFSTETYPVLNAACLYVDKINIKIHIDPTIYIASNYPKAGCMYNAVVEHEKKHVAVDRQIVNKYSTLIVNALNTTMKQVGYAQGPFSAQQSPSVQEKLNGVINTIVKQYSAQMSAERKVLQQKIDSLQEYDRVNNLCRNQR